MRREREGPKTHVGWPEEPQLRGVLMVRFRKSSNARRIAGMSQCVGYGVILRRTRRKMPPVRRGVTVRRKRVEEDGSGPEGSDFAAEEGGPDAEEGYEEPMDLVAYTHVCVRVCVCVFIIVDPLQLNIFRQV